MIAADLTFVRIATTLLRLRWIARHHRPSCAYPRAGRSPVIWTD